MKFPVKLDGYRSGQSGPVSAAVLALGTLELRDLSSFRKSLIEDHEEKKNCIHLYPGNTLILF